jgi:anti-anti-sigma regulatory factor
MSTGFSLPSELSIYTVSELRPQWLKWLDADAGQGSAPTSMGDVLWVDASPVADIDAAGVQLLVSLCSAAAGDGRALAFTNPSDALSRACAALGCSAMLVGHAAGGAAQ